MRVGEYFVIILFVQRASDLINFPMFLLFMPMATGARRAAVLHLVFTAIGEAGAANAGILAAQIIGTSNEEVMASVEAFRKEQTETVLANPDPSED